jgi:hypothetical protein
VSRVVGFCRLLARRTSRAYHIACARDDAASHKFTAPDGVWVCGGCEAVLLNARELSLHTAHNP